MCALQWPAVLVLGGDDELLYFEDYSAWFADTSIQDMVLTDDDRLIDVTGQVFWLFSDVSEAPKYVIEQAHVSLDQLIDLVKAHEEQKGSCCASKMAILNYVQGFEIVKRGQ